MKNQTEDKSEHDDDYLGYDDIHKRYTKEYIEFLHNYTENIKKINLLKQNLKLQFFYIVIAILVILILFFIFLVSISVMGIMILSLKHKENWEMVISATSGLIVSFSTVIVALNKLPKIIAKYLFNSNEDKHMTNMVKNIQTYEIQSVEKSQTTEAYMMQSKIETMPKSQDSTTSDHIKKEHEDESLENYDQTVQFPQ